MDRGAIAKALREIARRLELRGDEPFRARAYDRAAEALEDLLENLDPIVVEKRLTEIPGIGKGLAAVITELHTTGHARVLDELRAEMPPGILELADATRLSPAKLRALQAALGIETVADLESACRAGLVRTVHGFGAKTEQKILERIERSRTRQQRALLVDALVTADRIATLLSRDDEVEDVHLAGEARRSREVIDELDLVVESARPAELVARFVADGLVDGPGATGTRLPLKDREGVPVSLWISAPDDLGSVLVRATGSSEHVERLGELAKERGLSLDGARIEAEVYARAGISPPIAPELREGEGEIDAALRGALPADLVEVGDVRGLLHCHTDYSDGRATIEQMARAAEAMGAAYISITDHSPSAFYARGVAIDRLKQQWDEIARVQEKVSVRILRGTESDITLEGLLDYPDDVLEQLDVVIASIHVRGGLDEDQMTDRIVRAMKHPLFKIWGHGLGRLLERRPPIRCDVERILDVIAASRAAIEINGDPYRLDLEPRWARAAAERDIRFVVSTDAHSTEALGCVRFGVAMARRAGLTRAQVLNTLDAGEFVRAVRPAA